MIWDISVSEPIATGLISNSRKINVNYVLANNKIFSSHEMSGSSFEEFMENHFPHIIRIPRLPDTSAAVGFNKNIQINNVSYIEYYPNGTIKLSLNEDGVMGVNIHFGKNPYVVKLKE